MTIRELSLRVLHQYDTKDLYVKETLNEFLNRSSFDDRDRAFATELVYGCLRWRGRIDWILEKYIPRGLASLTPWIRNILRLGVYQILMLDHVPDAAATNEAVKLSKRFGHAGTVRLTNGVLRKIIRQRHIIQYPELAVDPIEHISVVYSYPEWIVQRWVKRYGIEETINLCKAGNASPSVVVRVNRLKTDLETLRDSLIQEGVQVEDSQFLNDFLILKHTGNIRSLESYRQGWMQIQDESAGLAVQLLDPQTDETIIDLCCAPGGKTTYIAQLMGDRGRIIGMDLSLRRLLRVRDHCQRLNLTSIQPIAMDGRYCTFEGYADRVLVDAPCSGLGTIARRAELRWRRTPEDIKTLNRTQEALLAHSASLVKPGGVIVYSTCTIEPDENEDIVNQFCKTHPEYIIESPSACPSVLSSVMDTRGMIRTLPSKHGTDGSFAVRLRKN